MNGVFATIFTELFVKQLLTLLGLILLQIILAVALALKQNKFEWSKLADFYRSLVLPYILGWLALIISAHFISADLLGPEYKILVGDIVTWSAWLVVVASLGARIVTTGKSLYGELIPFKEPLNQGERFEG